MSVHGCNNRFKSSKSSNQNFILVIVCQDSDCHAALVLSVYVSQVLVHGTDNGFTATSTSNQDPVVHVERQVAQYAAAMIVQFVYLVGIQQLVVTVNCQIDQGADAIVLDTSMLGMSTHGLDSSCVCLCIAQQNAVLGICCEVHDYHAALMLDLPLIEEIAHGSDDSLVASLLGNEHLVVNIKCQDT